ncbi:hypothetical protein NPX79_02935 [Spiroplasma endosymbiont of Anurida maritima]|uniref:hypothetical protein n=1 Tax=Spiroplasma endosymbiont of Anurida maritima TaxID=2967972 RepID=UPI0036D328AC
MNTFVNKKEKFNLDLRFLVKLFGFLIPFIATVMLYINGLLDLKNIKELGPDTVGGWNTTPETWNAYSRDLGDFSFNFFSYFTIITNMFVMFWFLISMIGWKNEGLCNHNKKCYAISCRILGFNSTTFVTTYITITMIIYMLMLLPLEPPVGAINWAGSMMHHLVTPIIMIIYYVCFYIKPKFLASKNIEVKSTKEFFKKDIFLVIIFPILWGVIMMVRGEFRHYSQKPFQYQYFFMYIRRSGADMPANLPGWAWFIIAFSAVVAIIVAGTAVYITLTNKGLKKYNKNPIITKQAKG